MGPSHGEVARRRLTNSLLIGSSIAAPEEVVRHHGAMQAQEYRPAKWAIGRRASGLVDGDVERVVRSGAIIRTHVLRPTWHFVAREDIRWMLALTAPRVYQSIKSQYRILELDETTLERSRKLIAAELEGGRRLTRKQIGEVLRADGIDPAPLRLTFIVIHFELEGLVCSGGLDGKQQTYALFDERVPEGSSFDRDDALVELTRRYLASHGPATLKDLGWWSSMTLADLRRAVHMLGDEVRSETIDDLTLWSMAERETVPATPSEAHLLTPFDEIIVGYSGSRFHGDALGAKARLAWKDRARERGVVMVDGAIAGRWSQTVKKGNLTVDVVTYEKLGAKQMRAIETESDHLGHFLGLPPTLSIDLLR